MSVLQLQQITIQLQIQFQLGNTITIVFRT